MDRDVKSLTEEQVLEMALKEAEKRGVELMGIKHLPSADDYYLRYVLCHDKKGQEYITWLYNIERGGFHQGHYFSYYWEHISKDGMKKKAIEDFNNR